MAPEVFCSIIIIIIVTFIITMCCKCYCRKLYKKHNVCWHRRNVFMLGEYVC